MELRAPTVDEQYRAFVEAHRGDLLRTATFLAAGDSWAAEDLVQTALVRLYLAWPRLRAETVLAYARRCLLNALIDHRRLASSRRERVRPEPPERVADEPGRLDRRSEVFTALAQLPPRMRAAVVMRHLLELSVEETAEALSCSTGTVKSQTARGLDQLRATLAGSDAAPDLPPPPSLRSPQRPERNTLRRSPNPSHSPRTEV